AWLYRRAPIVRFIAVSTTAFAVIALGPGLRINGAEVFRPLPFALFQLLPIFNGNRYPSRYSVMITLGMALLVGLAANYILSKLGFAAGRQAFGDVGRARLMQAIALVGIGL